MKAMTMKGFKVAWLAAVAVALATNARAAVICELWGLPIPFGSHAYWKVDVEHLQSLVPAQDFHLANRLLDQRFGDYEVEVSAPDKSMENPGGHDSSIDWEALKDGVMGVVCLTQRASSNLCDLTTPIRACALGPAKKLTVSLATRDSIGRLGDVYVTCQPEYVF